MSKRNESNSLFLELLEQGKERFNKDELQPLLSRYLGANLEFLEAVIDREIIEKNRACRVWADSLEVAYVNPLEAVVTREAQALIPQEIASKARVIGLYVIDEVLTVAMATPKDEALVKRISGIAKMPVSALFAPPREVQHAIDLYYSTLEEVETSIFEFEKSQRGVLESISDEDLKEMSESNSLSKIVDTLIFYSIRERASDVHLEAREDHARFRLRIDGKLVTISKYGKALHRTICARIKVLCGLDLAEDRRPQDGRFSLGFGLGNNDFRVSFIPSINGSKMVLRILGGGSKTLLQLDQMLISQRILNPFRRILASPNGLIFVTGPTGSGKTSTLYAALTELNVPSKNISTIEDPVEIQLEGITQSQVNNHIGLKFDHLLRSILRQDPDIILVGEIRDLETAKIATEAALTGHLVMSTLHTNTAIQAIIRLTELGIEPYMFAPSLLGVIGQRLAGRICESCKHSYYPGTELLEQYFTDIPHDHNVALYQGRGCVSCHNSGYRGRIAFHELVLIDNNIRSLITRKADQTELIRAAQRIGFKSLRYDALIKALLGLTTIEEVTNHTSLEWAD